MTKQPDQGWRDWVLSHSLPKMEEATTAGTAGFTPAPANPQPFSGPMSLAPSFDVIELLPPAATDKLRMLRQRAADAHALVPEFESIREASMARVEAENALKRLVAHPSENGFGLKPDDGQVIAAQRALDKATADFRRLQELQTARTAQWQAASGALAATETWLKSSRPSGTALEDFEGEPPELLKGEKGLLDAIENRRRRVREIKASIHTIQSAPYPSKHAKACMREIVEQLAARGTPDVSLLIEHDRREIVWPKVRVRSEVLGTERGLAFHEEIDVAGLFAFFLKPTVLSVLGCACRRRAG